ncbi:MAG: hypothetical protein Q7V62_17630 [Actinomycetota bacterium]|nr:hypothetical protein [Actinomycetota bacterium]
MANVLDIKALATETARIVALTPIVAVRRDDALRMQLHIRILQSWLEKAVAELKIARDYAAHYRRRGLEQNAVFASVLAEKHALERRVDALLDERVAAENAAMQEVANALTNLSGMEDVVDTR